MASNTPAVPAFLTFLFDPKRKHDVYFLVGNQDHATPEKIGAVKMMLSAHSEVFYRELEDSKLAEKDVIPVIDICPQTFRNLLKYIYGYDIISSCTFDEADNLLYVAEKYLMDPLKNKLALRLMSLLNCDNICSLMNNPACYRHLELNDAITEILQTETKRVLESPQFLNMSSGAFLKLLEQEAMNVPEVEVWRAAVKWAKDKVRCDEGEKMRNELTPPCQAHSILHNV